MEQYRDRSGTGDLAGIAVRLFEPVLHEIVETSSPRAWAFALMGIHAYLRRFSNDRVIRGIGETLAERLASLFRESASIDWPWCEDTVSYSNARLPHALLLTSQWTGKKAYARIGFELLEWLASIQTSEEGYFMPIGSNGFYRRGARQAEYDQQPVEAGVMVSACLEAYQMSRNEFWLNEAQRAFGWFLGVNAVGLPLYDADTGGCHDGLHPDRLNRNQGAESTLAFLSALVEMSSSRKKSILVASKDELRKMEKILG